jgi:hypothetical protein
MKISSLGGHFYFMPHIGRFRSAGAGTACIVGALAPYNHGVPLAGDARDFLTIAGMARSCKIRPVAF